MGKTPAQENKRKLEATKKQMAEERKKTKCKEDLAFGIKNQKGKVGAINADRLRAQAANAGRTKAQIEADEAKKEKQRERSRLKKEGWSEEEILLGKRVVDKQAIQQLAPGVDPKTVLCGYYKAGKCHKGQKCKFSHNLDIERQGKGKRSLYEDPRLKDTIDKWDTAKLEEVVNKKEITNQNATQKVCNYFIKAIETKKYGWFWKCDNGKDCLYQHKLPPGFILKSDLDEEKVPEQVDIGEWVEEKRAKLDPDKATPVTLETFMKWKAEAKKKKEEQLLKDALQVQKEKKKFKHASGLTGRALFAYRPNLFEDDLDAADDADYEYEVEENEGEEKEKEEEDETKEWQAKEEPVMDEADLLAALKLQEEGGDDLKVEDLTLSELKVEDLEEDEKQEPTATEVAAAKAEAAEKAKAKREEKRLAKLAAKNAAKVNTAFELKQQAEQAEKDKEAKIEEERLAKEAQEIIDKAKAEQEAKETTAEPEDEEAKKKEAAERAKAKREEKRLAKLAAKSKAKEKPLTLFEMKQLAEKEEAERKEKEEADRLAKEAQEILDKAKAEQEAKDAAEGKLSPAEEAAKKKEAAEKAKAKREEKRLAKLAAKNAAKAKPLTAFEKKQLAEKEAKEKAEKEEADRLAKEAQEILDKAKADGFNV